MAFNGERINGVPNISGFGLVFFLNKKDKTKHRFSVEDKTKS